MAMDFSDALAELPLVAILRGVKPEEAAEIGGALFTAGFRLIEVPLNSPDPLSSIEVLADRFGECALIGAGTVLSSVEARTAIAAGARLIVMPNADPEVIGTAKAADAWCMPGIATPSEAVAALKADADALKLFPAEILPPAFVKALKAVMPADVPLLPVGGIAPKSMADYVAAGAAGFGIGSSLYKPGATAEEVASRAAAFVEAWRAIGR
ncbi:MAG: 2-dehydro-3-deoxy-6-phosphogalactonate aldolase [Propylenella sp.]